MANRVCPLRSFPRPWLLLLSFVSFAFRRIIVSERSENSAASHNLAVAETSTGDSNCMYDLWPQGEITCQTSTHRCTRLTRSRTVLCSSSRVFAV